MLVLTCPWCGCRGPAALFDWSWGGAIACPTCPWSGWLILPPEAGRCPT